MTGLWTVKETAAWLGVTCEWVRDHAGELGASRLGDGPRAPYRFDPVLVQAYVDGRRITVPEPPVRRRPGPARRPAGMELLPLPEGAR
jgi:hypothetical protein